MNVPSSRIIDTHNLDDDPAHPASRVARWTCALCGRVVLVNGTAVSGSATETPCDQEWQQ